MSTNRDESEPPVDLLAALQRSIESAKTFRDEAEVERLRSQRDAANSRTLRMWERAESAERALADERAKVARVEALPDEWDAEADAADDYPLFAQARRIGAREIRATLADPEGGTR